MPEQRIGPYRLLSILGQGQDTIVYKAWQQSVDRPVTLKVLRQPKPDAMRRLQAEARLTASLAGAAVRQVYDVGQGPEGQLYIALQYVDHSLRDWLDVRKAQRNPFSRDEVADVLASIAHALDEMHRQGWVHLDIKPENILIFQDTRQAVLADLGIVQKIGAVTSAGTPRYASPEQAASNQPVGPWSDVYSLGVVAYEMVAGQPPFTATLDVAVLRQHMEDTPLPLRRLRRDVEGGLEDAIARALSKDPHRRFAAAGEFVEALRKRQTPIALVLKRTSTLLKATPIALERRPWLGVIPLGLVLVASIICLGLAPAWKPLMPAVATLTPSRVATQSPPPATPSAAPTSGGVAPTKTIMPTVTPPPTRSVTRAPTPTPTLAATLYPSVYLDRPPDGEQLAGNDPVTFAWSWGERSLKPDERYRFRFLRDGQLVGQPSIGSEHWRDHSGPPAGLGSYEWCVDVVQVDQAGTVARVVGQSACRRVAWR